MFCEPVEIDELIYLIGNLNNNKGAGPDNTGPRLLQEMSSAIIQPFLPRDALLSAVYAVVVCLCVCVSVCPSHSGIVLKRLNEGSRKQRRTIAP